MQEKACRGLPHQIKNGTLTRVSHGKQWPCASSTGHGSFYRLFGRETNLPREILRGKDFEFTGAEDQDNRALSYTKRRRLHTAAQMLLYDCMIKWPVRCFSGQRRRWFLSQQTIHHVAVESKRYLVLAQNHFYVPVFIMTPEAGGPIRDQMKPLLL